MGLLRRIADKPHQRRYVISPASVAALLVFGRFREITERLTQARWGCRFSRGTCCILSVPGLLGGCFDAIGTSSRAASRWLSLTPRAIWSCARLRAAGLTPSHKKLSPREQEALNTLAGLSRMKG